MRDFLSTMSSVISYCGNTLQLKIVFFNNKEICTCPPINHKNQSNMRINIKVLRNHGPHAQIHEVNVLF